MARLQPTQIPKLLKSPKNKRFIEAAQRQEERLVFHCDPILEKQDLPSNAFRDFSAWAKSIITAEKFVRFAQLLETPLHTVATMRGVFDQLSKFLDAQDRFVKYEFTDSELESDFTQYLDGIKDPDFWRTEGLDALRIGINDILVVDLPAVQTTKRPDPFYYRLSINNVIDVDYNERTDDCEYLIYKVGSTDNCGITIVDNNMTPVDVVVIDDDYYRTYSKDKDVYTLVSEVAHNLGYTPAISFYKNAISKTKKINKRGPVTDQLMKLDWLLFFTTIAKYYFLYGPFPIIVSYELAKNEWDEKNAELADNTLYIPKSWSPYDFSPGDVRDPKKDDRHLIGAGSTMKVPGPKKKDDFDMMANPIKVIEMTVDNLDWVKNYCEDLADEIISDCTGEDGDLLQNSQPKNADQIAASFERKVAILNEIKTNFERCHKFVVATVARFRYSPAYLVNITIAYGADYFLKDATTLTNEFEGAVKAGLNMGYTSSLRRALIATKYKNNPEELARQMILIDVEPYPDLSWMQMQAAQLDIVDEQNFVLKLNFTTFVSRFEQENGNMVTFGSLIDYKTKIQTIKNTLLSYGKDINGFAAIGNGTAKKPGDNEPGE